MSVKGVIDLAGQSLMNVRRFDLCGRNVLHSSTIVLLRVRSKIDHSPYLFRSNEHL